MTNPDDPWTIDQGMPVPRFTPWQGRNHDPRGWTAARQLGFMRALTRCGSARAAAAAVGKSVRSAYLLRDKPGAESFAAAWDQAAIAGRRASIDAATLMAFGDGPIRYSGKATKRDQRLMLGVLNAVGRETARGQMMDDYAAIWNRLREWEDALNRVQMDLEDPAWRERSQAEAEAAHRHRIWRAEMKRSQRLAYQREVRAKLRRQREQAVTCELKQCRTPRARLL